MSQAEVDWSLPATTKLTREESSRLVGALDALLTALTSKDIRSYFNEADDIACELRAARLLAEFGAYRYDTMSALVAKQMLHIGNLDHAAQLKSLAGDVLKAHLNVRP